MRTQVAIVGAGPAGLTLALLLQRAGTECVIVEHRSREHVERRARAGLLEQNTVELMHELGVADAFTVRDCDMTGSVCAGGGRRPTSLSKNSPVVR